jgi:hypothetical protein
MALQQNKLRHYRDGFEKNAKRPCDLQQTSNSILLVEAHRVHIMHRTVRTRYQLNLSGNVGCTYIDDPVIDTVRKRARVYDDGQDSARDDCELDVLVGIQRSLVRMLVRLFVAQVVHN